MKRNFEDCSVDSSVSIKKQRGQFFSTKAVELLEGLEIPNSCVVVDPFCGQCDLFQAFVGCPNNNVFELYDIEPKEPREGLESLKLPSVIERNTLKNPIDYTDKFVLTNPPYLAKNKTKDSMNRECCDHYKVNDLFKCFLKTLLDDENQPLGGAIVLPLAFFSSFRKKDQSLRLEFLHKFRVERLNVFEKRMFKDTSYTVCAFKFVKRPGRTLPEREEIPISLYRDDGICLQRNLECGKGVNGTFGNEVFQLQKMKHPDVLIHRLLDTEEETITPNTSLTLFALDGKTRGSQIRLECTESPYFGKHSSRTKASFNITFHGRCLTKEEEWNLVLQFNSYLDKMREKYGSLFLTQYRDGSRKRIAFTMAAAIMSNILSGSLVLQVPQVRFGRRHVGVRN